MKLKKLISSAVATILAISSASGVFAIKDVSFVNNNDGTATVTATDINKIAVAQYNDAGALKSFGISSLVGGKQSATFSYDDDATAYVYAFNDWANLSSDTKSYKIDNNTLAYIDFEGIAESPFIYYDFDFDIDKRFETTDKNGNPTTAMSIVGDGTSETTFNVQFSGCTSDKSDVVVYEYDVKVEDADTAFNSYIKSVKPSGAAGGWHSLWNVTPKDDDEVNILFDLEGVATDTLAVGEWYRLSAVADYNARIVRYYIDGEYKGEGPMVNNIHPSVYPPDIFYISGNAFGYLNILVDNVRVYEGTELRETIDPYEIVLDLTKSSITDIDETSERSALAGKYAVHTRSGVTIDNEGNKTLLVNKPYTDNNEIYVPLAELCGAWGIDAPSVSANDEGYVKLTDLAVAMGLNVYTPESEINSGLAVLSASFTAPTGDALQDLNDFVFYLRPTADDVKEMYEDSADYGVHPRLFANQADFDAIKAKYDAGDDEAFMTWANQVISHADSRMNTDDATYDDVQYSGRTAQRKLKSDVYSWAMAYHLTGDRKYVEETFRELSIFCNMSDWKPSDHLHIAETLDAFAIGYDWLYNEFTAEERAILEENVYNKGFANCYLGFRTASSAMTNAFNASNNHGVVCNSGMMVSALAFMDKYPNECAWFASNAMRGMENSLHKWHNGAWWEGPHYWEYTTIYTVKFIESMMSILDSDCGFKSLEGLNNAAEYEIGMHGSLGIFNYSDALLTKCYVPEMLWLAKEYNDPKVATKVVNEYSGSFSSGNRRVGEMLALAVLWYDPEMIDDTAQFSNDYFYDGLNVITMREGWDNDDVFVGVKAGVLNEAHSQLDSGSFIFESDGIRWLRDLGMGSYVDGYFDSGSGGLRWRDIAARAEGHSTVSVNPGIKEDMNLNDPDAKATMTVIDKNDSGAIVEVDMSEVLFDVKDAKRGFFFTDNRESLVVRDEITMKSREDKVIAEDNFDGKTSTDIFGSYISNYEIISGEGFDLDEGDDIAKITGENKYFNNNAWNATAGTRRVTYEFDLYLDDVRNKFQFYPTGSNRYGLQVGGDENGTVYEMKTGFELEATEKTVEAGEWYHFAVEYDMAEGKMLIYMDDELIYTQTAMNTSANAPADHNIYQAQTVAGKYAYINNLICYEGGYGEIDENVVYWRLITDPGATVTVDDENNLITMTKNGKSCTVSYAIDGGTATEEYFEKPIVPIIDNARPFSEQIGRVVIKITGATEDVNITAKVTPDGVANPTPLSDYTNGISTWELN